MQVKNLYQPFEIEIIKTSKCPMGAHRHNFFELVYIVCGKGVQCINQNQLPYEEEALFLITPQDCHSFHIQSDTTFFFIRFNNVYLNSQGREWIKQLDFIFQGNSHLPGCILKNKTDKPLVKSLITALEQEYENQQPYQREIAAQIVNTMLSIVARNIALTMPVINNSLPETRPDIIGYVHQNIYSPQLLRAEHLAAQFNISPSYISEYFKKLTGENLQQYITNYKLKLVETRLRYSDLRMSEIAFELNFTDESHLNRIFKKYRGQTPSQFRRQNKVLAI